MAARLNKGFFTKVKVARELLKEKSEEILREYLQTVSEARVAGDYETATKALQWLIEHMPADEDGNRIVEQSVDKKQEVVQAPTGPAIQIGIQVGGAGAKQLNPPKPKELSAIKEAVVIENE